MNEDEDLDDEYSEEKDEVVETPTPPPKPAETKPVPGFNLVQDDDVDEGYSEENYSQSQLSAAKSEKKHVSEDAK